MNKGVIYAALAYLLWGVFPVFWKAVQHVPAYESLGHRMFWTFIIAALLLIIRKDKLFFIKIRQPRTLLAFIGSSFLIVLNWFTFIWSVNNNYILEVSLGYFINPLVHVLFGIIFLKERLRKIQLVGILIAALGVLYLTFNYGRFPWIAMVLAISFAFYALLRKTAKLDSLEALTLETGIAFIPALFYLIWFETAHQGSFFHTNYITPILLMATGIITALPLLLFGAGAQKIKLVTLGILQYIAPTLQFLLGLFIYHEHFPRERFVGFVIIWIAVAIYTFDSIYVFKTNRQRIAQA